MELSTPIKAIDEFDVSFGTKRIGDVLLELGYITETQLNRALEYQEQKGGKLGWILATQGYITRLELFEGLARHSRLPFETDVPYLRGHTDTVLITMLSHEEITEYQTMPFQVKGRILTVLTSDPNNQNANKLFYERFDVDQINQIVVTDLDLMKISEEFYRDSLLENSIHGLQYTNPSKSASKVVTSQQLIIGIVFISGILGWCYLNISSIFCTGSLYSSGAF